MSAKLLNKFQRQSTGIVFLPQHLLILRRVVIEFYRHHAVIHEKGLGRQGNAFPLRQDSAFRIGGHNGHVGIARVKRLDHFLLLSDPDHAVLELYDVWKEKKQYGKVSMGTVRSTYLIGPDGVIRKAMPKVKPDTNAADVLTALDALTANA